jgi:Fe-Mn family superoxide dismutase
MLNTGSLVAVAIAPMQLLEDIRYWKRQELEQTQVIRAVSPLLEPDYVKLLGEWEAVLSKMENTSDRLAEALMRSGDALSPQLEEQIAELMRISLLQSEQFADQLQAMRSDSAVIQDDPVTQKIILLLVRQSEYFLQTLGSYKHLSAARNLPFPALNTVPNQANTMMPTNEQHHDPRPPIPDQQPVPIGQHILPPLPYPYNALEPAIDEKTMRLHHDIHHQKYVDDLNKAEIALEQARKSGNFDLIKHWERELAFNGAGHYLHTLFWNIMSPQGGGKATGAIAAQIDRDFGSFDAFKQQFSQAAEKVEGGGWAILVWSPRSHRLEILQAEKHQNLSQWDVIPLLALDVWEHAYYLKYNAERAKYIAAWWDLVNWTHVNERFATARTVKWYPY